MECTLRLIKAFCAPALLLLALSGCGGDDVSVNPISGTATADSATTTSTTTTTTATASISGTPATSVVVGQTYNFLPAASDSDGGTVTFSITNAPSWASFNTSTGLLTGSPGSTNVGTTSNIVISVADGKATASLAAFSITVSATTATTTPTSPTGTAKVSWTAPTENTNGTALTDLAGYTVYYGTSSSSLTQSITVANPSATSYVVSGLTSGTWYFAVASYTSSGTESAQSPVSSKTI
jgi:hypothetical protein